MFGLSDAVRLAWLAVDDGIAKYDSGEAFACWLCDVYDGEDVEYVERIGLSTLWGRFLDEPRYV